MLFTLQILYVIFIYFCLKVRAAAVFALGKLIANVGDRSDHANTIDHGVATTLASTVGNDGSPLVRKACKPIFVVSHFVYV